MLFTGLSLYTIRYLILFFLCNLSYIYASKTPLLPDGKPTQVSVTISPDSLTRSSSHGEFGQTGQKKNRGVAKPTKSINRSPEATVVKKSNRSCCRSGCSRLMKALSIITVALGLLNTAMFYDLTMKAEKLSSSINELSTTADQFSNVVQGIDHDVLCAAAKVLNVTKNGCP